MKLCSRSGVSRALLCPAVLALALTVLAADAGRLQAKPARAMWVVRYSLLSRESIDRMVRRAASGSFDNLFIQVCGRGDAYFPSTVYPVADNCRELVEAGFDPLAYVVAKAHERGIRVHAWVNTLLVWSGPKDPPQPGHVLNRHPEWMMIDRGGGSMADYSWAQMQKLRITGVFLSPAEPAVAAHVGAFVHELAARYPLDGIHLDYIRYPMSTVDFSVRARTGFTRLHGADPLELFRSQGAAIRTSRGDEAYSRLLEAWSGYRAGLVTEFVRGLRKEAVGARPGISLSAAVKPAIESAYLNFGQDWPRWVSEGLVDMVLPMSYSTREEVVREQIAEACRAVGASRVWAGLRAYDVSVWGIEQRVRTILPLSPGGVCFFSYDGVRDNDSFFQRVPRLLR